MGLLVGLVVGDLVLRVGDDVGLQDCSSSPVGPIVGEFVGGVGRVVGPIVGDVGDVVGFTDVG